MVIGICIGLFAASAAERNDRNLYHVSSASNSQFRCRLVLPSAYRKSPLNCN